MPSGNCPPPAVTHAAFVVHAGVREGDDFFTVSVGENREAYDAAARFGEALSAEGFEGKRPRDFPCTARSTTG